MPIVWTLTTGAGKYLEHAGTRRKGESRDEEGDEEGVDKPVLLEKAGQLFVAAHPEDIAPVQVHVQSSTLQVNLIGQCHESYDLILFSNIFKSPPSTASL